MKNLIFLLFIWSAAQAQNKGDTIKAADQGKKIGADSSLFLIDTLASTCIGYFDKKTHQFVDQVCFYGRNGDSVVIRDPKAYVHFRDSIEEFLETKRELMRIRYEAVLDAFFDVYELEGKGLFLSPSLRDSIYKAQDKLVKALKVLRKK